MDTRLALRPVEAAEAIGIGRSKVYELLATGELPSIQIGGCKRVPVEMLREWINQKADGARPYESGDVTRVREQRTQARPSSGLKRKGLRSVKTAR